MINQFALSMVICNIIIVLIAAIFIIRGAMNKGKINYKKMRKAAEKYNIPEVDVQEIKIEKNQVDMKVKHPFFIQYTEYLANFFIENNGINYVSVRMYSERLGFFDVIIQRAEGEAIAEMNDRLKVELKKREEEVKELKIKLEGLDNVS